MRARARRGGVEDVDQVQHGSRPGAGDRSAGERQHAEPGVDKGSCETHLARGGEHLLEVELLPAIDDDDDQLGTPGRHPVLDRGEVGGAVQEGPVALADRKNGVGKLFPILGRERNDHRAFGRDGETRRDELLDEGGEPGFVGRFAEHDVEVHPESGVYRPEFGEGRVDEPAPQGAAVRITVLKPGGPGPGRVVERGILLRALPEELVQSLEFSDRVGVEGRVVAPCVPGDDELAERGSPVTQVVVGDHPPAGEPVQAVDRAADDRGAKVPDVHSLGDVRRREVDDHRPAGADLRRSECRIADSLLHVSGQRLGRNAEVEEARTGDVDVGDQIGRGKGGDQAVGHGQGRRTRGLRKAERQVRLVVSMLRVAGGDRRVCLEAGWVETGRLRRTSDEVGQRQRDRGHGCTTSRAGSRRGGSRPTHSRYDRGRRVAPRPSSPRGFAPR